MNNPKNPTRSPWLYDVKPFNMVENLYYVGNKSVSSHLFDTGEGLLLLDTTYMQTAYLLLESIRELGFDPKDIRWVIHSHAHYDHFGATRLLKEKYGCEIYMPAVDIPFLNDRTELNYCVRAGQFYDIPYDTYFDVDVPINDGDEFTFGNIKMKAVAAPGHTPGTMAYFFTLPSGLIAAMHGGIGRNTLASDYLNEYHLGKKWRNDFADTLNKLKNYHVDVVMGNHPDQSDTFEKQALVGKTDENPFVDETYWCKMIDRTFVKYEAMLVTDPMENIKD